MAFPECSNELGFIKIYYSRYIRGTLYVHAVCIIHYSVVATLSHVFLHTKFNTPTYAVIFT